MTLSFAKPVEHPKAEGYNIRIGNDWFRTIANNEVPIQIGSRDSLAQRQDQGGSIYQNVLDLGYAWGRTDLSGGEGLDWSPREIALEQNQTALDEIRYWDSEGINNSRPDVEGDQYTLRLARTFGDSVITVTDPVDIGISRTRIYIADGQTVVSYTDWDGTAQQAYTGLPVADIVSMAVAPNDTVMVTVAADGSPDSGDIFVKPSGTTVFEIAYDASVQMKPLAKGIWYLQGRFIGSGFTSPDSSFLFEMVWNGTDWTDTVLQLDTADAEFFSVVESGPAIVAACGDGTVRSYTPDSSGATPTMNLIPRSRTTMPHGETPILLGSNANILLIMTTADLSTVDRQEVRVYRAEVLDARFDFVVGQLQLIREHLALEHDGDVNRSMTNTRDEIFYLVREKVTSSEHDFEIFLEALWRYDLVTGGLTRIIYEQIVPNSTVEEPVLDPLQSEQTNLNTLVVFDQIIGTIDFTGDRIRISDPNLHQAFGYMVFPNITFGLNTPITWIATVVEAHDLVSSGGQVELWYSTNPTAILDWNDPSWVLAQRLSPQGASNVEIPFQGLNSRTLALQLRMFATEGATTTPKVTRIALRGIPAHRDLIMMVPLNISDIVSAPGRAPIRIPGHGNALHERVLALVGENVEAIILDPLVRFQGVVNNISEPVTFVSNRGSVTKHVLVEFRGSRLPGTATQAPTGDDGMGLGTMGIATIGIGQTEGT